MMTDHIGPMAPSPALRAALHLAAFVPNGHVVEHPLRAVSWRNRDQVFPDTAEREAALVESVRSFASRVREADPGVHVVVEGLCRVMLGGRSGGRGEGERFTGLVVHVVADGEPARSVLLPLE